METIEQNGFTGIPFERELVFTSSRSSGPGGQHVNKVSTKVELRFHIPNSGLLNDEEKDILLIKLKNKINSEGELIIVSQDDRSQLKNKEKAIEKFYELLQKALTPPKKRKPTKPTPASKEKRLEKKRIIADKKEKRKPPDAL
ncbi:MAG: aminoacyl-tRNA hydrolase [Bacteroidetes bacterium]|nr:aminoacyl-tRNA hydrolase [Bacteroidota bacterium]MBL7104392.1 aminoacyl-tRNA hydrolase [Bacteroidales bacterium]